MGVINHKRYVIIGRNQVACFKLYLSKKPKTIKMDSIQRNV